MPRKRHVSRNVILHHSDADVDVMPHKRHVSRN